MTPKIPCPYCWHKDTMGQVADGLDAEESEHYESNTMRLIKPSPAMGGSAYLRCAVCCLTLTPEQAHVLLDAALRVSVPDCDSYNHERHTYEDCLVAIEGCQEF